MIAHNCARLKAFPRLGMADQDGCTMTNNDLLVRKDESILEFKRRKINLRKMLRRNNKQSTSEMTRVPHGVRQSTYVGNGTHIRWK